MPGPSARQRLSLASLLVLSLAACLPAERTVPRQIVVEWPARHLAFIADERVGSVKAFRIGAGAPVLVAQSSPFSRSAVLDLQLDAARGRLWVLGRDSVDLHAAEGLALRKRLPLDARAVARLRVEGDGVVLLAAGGEILGRIDPARLIAVWRSVPDASPG